MQDDSFRAADASPPEAPRAGERGRLPVLCVLHQPHSNPGQIGHQLRAMAYALDIRRPRYGDPLPETLADHAGAVIFGGPMSANDPDDYIRVETDWIGVALKEEKPFLGICLGGQMLARHLGCTVSDDRDGRVEIGYHPLQALADAHLGGAWPERVFQWHREGFDVPRGAKLLAVADGPFVNQAFSHGRAAIGLQFHPEITYALVSRWSGRAAQRLEQTGAQDRAGQLADHIANGPVVRAWLGRFLADWLRTGR